MNEYLYQYWGVTWLNEGEIERVYFFHEEDARLFKQQIEDKGMFAICWRTPSLTWSELIQTTST